MMSTAKVRQQPCYFDLDSDLFHSVQDSAISEELLVASGDNNRIIAIHPQNTTS